MRALNVVAGDGAETCGVIEESSSLQASWALVDICAGSLDPDDSDALHASDSDSVLFLDKLSGTLIGMRIRIPEINVPAPLSVMGEMPSTKGLPFRRRGSSTGLRTPAGRYYDPDLDRLIVPYDPCVIGGSMWRLEAGPDLALVVASESPAAWILERASLNLESPKSGHPKTACLGAVEARRALAAYLSLVDDAPAREDLDGVVVSFEVVPLGVILGVDESLSAVLELEVGEGISRDDEDGESEPWEDDDSEDDDSES